MSTHHTALRESEVDPKAATAAIIRRIRMEEATLRQRHGWLAVEYQDRMGLLWFGAAWVWMVGVAVAWLAGVLPGWVATPMVALGLSVLHELEHDLIHDLYLVKRPWAQDCLFACIWIAKMSLNPWSRRHIHRFHHRVSGQPEDIEERLIGLGMPWGLRRLLLSVLPMGSLLVIPALKRDVRAAARAGAPLPNRHHRRGFGLVRLVDGLFLLVPFVVIPLAWLGDSVALALAVLWVLPNTIRHVSIVVVSSSSHYTAGSRTSLFEQNQVLDHWVLWPLQLFCWNFGATHILHHYVVKQPFYVRQMVYPRVRSTLRKLGVPFNDLGTFARANRRIGASGAVR